ncbi:MAG: hypothetical protein WHU10_06720 [Fimbriimonadales bacterium]
MMRSQAWQFATALVCSMLIVLGTVQASLVRGTLVAFPPCCLYTGVGATASGPCDACRTLECCLTGCRGYCTGLAYEACIRACWIKFPP